jgi:integrase
MKLTKSAIEAMVYEKSENKADLRPDSELKGFGVRVYPSGEKGFFIRYRFNGTKRTMMLGSFGHLTLQQARDLARDKLAEVRKGNDPLSDRKHARDELTLAQYAERYEAHFSRHKRGWAGDKQRIETHILPALGKKRLSAISLDDLKRLQAKLLSTPAQQPSGERKRKSHETENDVKPKKYRTSPLKQGTVNRIMAVVLHMLNEAVRDGYISASPGRSLRMFPAPKPRDIFLSPEQLRRILDSADAEQNAYAGALIKIALLTGRRIGELRTAQWDNLNVAYSTMTAPETKSGDQQTIILSPLALTIITALPRLADNPFVFAGVRPKRPLNNYVKPWRRVLMRAGIPYVPIHGLRHSAVTNLLMNGVPVAQAASLMGHKDTRTTERHYFHFQAQHGLEAATLYETIVTPPKPTDEQPEPANDEGERIAV